MKNLIFYIFFIGFFLCAPAQIQVNEFFADNGDCCLDDFNETEDFLELINLGPSPIDLAGYFFGDQDGGTTIQSGYPEITTISSGGVLVLWYDNDPDQGPLHIEAKLNNDGENIIGIDPEGNAIIDIVYGAQSEDVSFIALPDGATYDEGWSFSMCPTPGEFNQDCPLLEGCTSPNATNYNANATIEDASCLFGVFNGIMINEYSASNCDNDGGDCGDYEDWVELFNNSQEPVDLQGYFLSDKIDNLLKWQFPNSLILQPQEHVVIYASGLNPDLEISTNETSFKLSQTKNNEYIILVSPDLTTIDYVQLSRHKLNHSIGRTADGASDWSIFTNSSPGGANTDSYINYKATPYFNYNAGFYENSIELIINCDDVNVDIYYTLDGSIPNTGSALYGSIDQSGNIQLSEPGLIVDNTVVVRAIAISQDNQYLNSFVETNTYFLNQEHTMHVISIAGSQVDNLLYGNQIRPIGSFEIFNSDGALIDEAVGEFNKHGNDSWAYDQRGLDFIIRDQYGYNHAINDKLFTTKDRDSFQRLILKCAANDNYPATFGSPAHIRDSYCHSLSQIGDLRMDERSHESCILYVNGEYWGVYDYREKVDDLDFLEYYYDQGEGYVDFLKTWGGTWVEFGDNTTENEWDDLVDFITGNDMSDIDNYTYVKSVYNTGSLIDYFILNSYVVAMDWLNWNTGWWRGKNPNGDKRKWRYILWDMDATFGHYVNYTGIPDTGAGADPCDPETLGDPGGQGHVPILNALFDNDEFSADYINRYADLSNTIFSCDFMIGHLDSLINIIEPEMPAQIERWGGSFSQWEDNVQELRDFILERCSDEFVEGMEDCYDVEAMNVTVIIEGDGEVELNSIELDTENSPWTGVYYSGLPISMSANASSNAFNFYWEVIEGDLVLEDPTNPDIIFDLSSTIVIVAHFEECLSVATEEIVGPTVVQEGSIWQYTFPSEFTNTSEWSVSGGEILFTSSSENTIAIQWNYGTGQGQIVLSQYNIGGDLECLFTAIEITEAPIKYECLGDGICEQSLTGQFLSYEDCVESCEQATSVFEDLSTATAQVIVFPNPSEQVFNVVAYNTNATEMTMYDLSGKLVYHCSGCFGENGEEPHAISLQSISSGIYVLKVQSPLGSIIKKVAVK
ncbi:MAG: hypothetical protein CMD26_00525 [Flavobacteriales bacterium]|nr:hypothetical protein [Flavobacteriales bacterium]|tara:strand:- start:9732 stop:13136 length:3405 start_codon:yes stop_codon:yes gene_type:complete